MNTITVRLNLEEEVLFTEYAKMHNMPLSTILKKSLEEKIENEYDFQTIKDYEKKVEEGTVKYFTHEEMLAILDVD